MHLIHDLKNALIAIAACLEMIRRRGAGTNEPLIGDINLVGRLLDSAFQMVDELIVSSELRATSLEVDVNRLITETIEILRVVVGPNITVQPVLGAAHSRVRARPLDLERILLNLVLNAWAAMPNGGVLVIETASSEHPTDATWIDPAAPFGDFRLTVTDNGYGMSETQLQKATNPFVRPLPDGRGLGLACVSLIVTRLDGKLEIASGEGGGTTVVIELPLATSPGGQIH